MRREQIIDFSFKNGCYYTAYLAPEGFEQNLKNELTDICAVYDRLFVCHGPATSPFWAQNVWYDACYIPVSSIADAAKKLKLLGSFWHHHSYRFHRRCHLIADCLPQRKQQTLEFPILIDDARTWGAWMLVENNLLLASPRTKWPQADGAYQFQENRNDPPSRAYLKLWETFTRFQRKPQKGETALEIGAAPGGWTWVLTQLECQVDALDRAPLDEKLMCNPLVNFVKGDAFSFIPDKTTNHYDWFFSDMICYPEKLWDYVFLWLSSGKVANFVVTLKFQGKDHYDIISNFIQVPGSKIVHLFHNKHELTWVKFAEE